LEFSPKGFKKTLKTTGTKALGWINLDDENKTEKVTQKIL
jgi:hypothetical protein